MRYAVAYLAALVALLALDAVWLGVIAIDMYREQIGHLLAPQPRWGVAAAFYALYLAGVVLFAVAPALQARSAVRAAVLGALLGLFAYMTYDLTNMATLRDWPLKVTVLDLIWGSFLTATASLAGYLAASRVAR